MTGERAACALADGSLYQEKGKLDFLDVTVDPKTDGQIVRAMFANKDDILTDGQTVRVIVEEKKPRPVVVIPQSAVADRPDRLLRLRRRRQEGSSSAASRLGTARDGLLVVEEGLKAGERVVVQGQQRVRAGMTVAPQLASPRAGQAEAVAP